MPQEEQTNQTAYVIDRLYPEYSHRQASRAVSRVKSQQDVKLEKKMLMVLYKLDRQLEQQSILRGKPRSLAKRKRAEEDQFANRYEAQSTKDLNISKNRRREDKDRSQTKDRMRSMSESEQKIFQSRAKTGKPIFQDAQFDAQKLIRKLKKRGKKEKSIPQSDRSLEKEKRKPKQKRSHTEASQSDHGELILPRIGRKADESGRNSKMQKLNMLLKKSGEEETKLGRLVVEKVEKHLELEKKNGDMGRKAKYFEKVKSEEDIDDTLITYLRNKVKQADIVMRMKK